MRIQQYFVLLLVCLLLTACLNDSSASPQMNQTDNKPAQNTKNNSIAETSKAPIKSTPISDCHQNNPPDNAAELLPNDKSVAGLNQMISNLVGDFVVDESRKSIFEGDFNNDGCQDIALILVVPDADNKTINDAASNTNIAVIKQNLRTKAKLLPQTRKEHGSIFPAAIKSQSDRALIVIIGNKSGWNWKHGIEGKIFLLLDSVFTVKDCPDCHTESVPRNSQKQGYDCFPKNSKGDGIFTGGEEAGKLIYFDGKSFAWTQCGD